jgi:putative transposase
MHRSHDLRKGRVSVAGQTYHVTCATAERRRLFDDFWLARVAMRRFGTVDASGETTTHAFMLMPDHMHWLFTLNSGTLSRAVARAKTLSSRDVRALRGDLASIWQKDYYDHALRTDEAFRGIGEYIVANPLRAELVNSPGDYPHWFAEWV